MITKSITISSKLENEQSPVALFVQLANRFQSEILVQTGTKTVNAKSIMGVMTLSFAEGSQMDISIKGVDEAEAMEGMTAFLCK